MEQQILNMGFISKYTKCCSGLCKSDKKVQKKLSNLVERIFPRHSIKHVAYEKIGVVRLNSVTQLLKGNEHLFNDL